jgi:uncharacterized membrane protein YjjP (DUF1212 family)
MTSDDKTGVDTAVDAASVRQLLLQLGVALTKTGDAVSEVQAHLRAIAAAYGYGHARIAVFPTLLIVALDRDESAGVWPIDSVSQLRLDQASDVIRLAQDAQTRRIDPAAALAELERILRMPSRFGTAAYVLSHAVLTVGLGSSSAPPPSTCGCMRRSARASAR